MELEILQNKEVRIKNSGVVRIIYPGDDVSSESQEVKDLAEIHHTEEAIEAINALRDNTLENPIIPDFQAVSRSFSPRGTHFGLFKKAALSEADYLLGVLAASLGSGNIEMVKSCLVEIINQMPGQSGFTREEIASLNKLFSDNHIPVLVEVVDGVASAS